MSSNIGIKKWIDLSDDEFAQIKASLLREFNVNLISKDDLKDKLFFLLKDNQEIVSMGALLKVAPVLFNGQQYSFWGFVNVISNRKGQGYGKQVMTSMREYLISRDEMGLGFCMPKNAGFYQKCGFNVVTDSTHRFVHRKGSTNITNQDGQIIFYQDSSAKFMQQILQAPEHNVFIPHPNLW